MPDAKVVIIGGGIIGLCSAYFLTRQGYKVTIIERNAVGQGCSLGNAGMLVPSHFIPLAAPGVIAKGIKWMLQPESPFSIALSSALSPKDIQWLWKFYRKANQTHVDKCTRTLRDLNMHSRALFEEMGRDPNLNLTLGQQGLFMLYKTAEAERAEKKMAAQAQALDLDVAELTGHQVQEMEPDVRVNVRGAIHYRCDSHLDPAQLMKSMTNWLTSAGATLLEYTEAVGFEQDHHGRLTSVLIHNKKGRRALQADEFVLAAGAFSAGVAKLLGDKLPMASGKGYSITLEEQPKVTRVPAIMTEAKATMTPMGNKLRFGGTMELAAKAEGINQAKVRGLWKAVSQYYPDFGEERLVRQKVWSGLRPCSPDGMPYIGRFKQHENLIAATGHSMMGVSLGPATGKQVSELIAGSTSGNINFNLMSPDR